jgi:hypothetical protein
MVLNYLWGPGMGRYRGMTIQHTSKKTKVLTSDQKFLCWRFTKTPYIWRMDGGIMPHEKRKRWWPLKGKDKAAISLSHSMAPMTEVFRAYARGKKRTDHERSTRGKVGNMKEMFCLDGKSLSLGSVSGLTAEEMPWEQQRLTWTESDS